MNRVLLADAGVLKKLENLDDKAFSDNPHRKRRYVSKDQETLYLQKDEQFTKKHSIELYGYWFVTNIGYKELSTVFEMVCSAADIDGQVKQGFKAIGDL